MPTPSDAADRIRAYLQDTKSTQAELADAAGISQSQVSRLSSGKARRSVDAWKKVEAVIDQARRRRARGRASAAQEALDAFHAAAGETEAGRERVLRLLRLVADLRS